MVGQSETHGLPVHWSGPPALLFMTFRDDEGRIRPQSRLRRRCAARGVYLHPHHNWFVSAALTDADVDRILDVTEAAFADVARSPEHRG
jgi:glutamate-1-semialdehyde 2,1-aminomutase